MRRQQAQEENEAKELSVLYGTSCEAILALKRSIRPDSKSQSDHNDMEDEEDLVDENDYDEGLHYNSSGIDAENSQVKKGIWLDCLFSVNSEI